LIILPDDNGTRIVTAQVLGQSKCGPGGAGENSLRQTGRSSISSAPRRAVAKHSMPGGKDILGRRPGQAHARCLVGGCRLFVAGEWRADIIRLRPLIARQPARGDARMAISDVTDGSAILAAAASDPLAATPQADFPLRVPAP